MTQVSTLRENAVPEVSFFAAEYTITSGMLLTVPHGLSKRPKQVWLHLKCLTAEAGYAVGDIVELGNSASVTASFNLNSIQVAFATLPSLVNFSTNAVAAITAANWNLVVKAEVA